MIQRNEANLHKNWQKELANVVTCPKTLLEMVGLSSQVHENDLKARSLFPVRVPIPFIKKNTPRRSKRSSFATSNATPSRVFN